jgi:hypothetical protein
VRGREGRQHVGVGAMLGRVGEVYRCVCRLDRSMRLAPITLRMLLLTTASEASGKAVDTGATVDLVSNYLAAFCYTVFDRRRVVEDDGGIVTRSCSDCSNRQGLAINLDGRSCPTSEESDKLTENLKGEQEYYL